MSVPTVTTSPENYAPILLNHNLRRVYIMYVLKQCAKSPYNLVGLLTL